ncbi:hypothetical protein IW147_004159 [Coemansia sp. RSA 720]|nr:hypothetical protein IW147_004159 [Coemansia sp. RSA 720]
MRTRNPTYSLSSSALDELSRILWEEQQQQSSDDDDGIESDNCGGYSAGAGSSVADSICTIDTLPRLSMGRVRPASASSSRSSCNGGIQLGRVRLRLRRRKRRRQQKRQTAQLPDRRVYRLPLSLQPSSMFDLKLRYTIPRRSGRNIAGDHNKYMHSAGKPLTPPLHPSKHRAERANSSRRGSNGNASKDRLGFPFSPSLSSLAVDSDAHYFCFASHLSDMISPQQGLSSTTAVEPTTAGLKSAGNRNSAVASACRCTKSIEGGRPHTTPCLQCYFRCNVVPRRGQFVHTQAGPVLDLASRPPSQPPSQPHTAPALTASWPSLSSAPNRNGGAMSDPENASATSLLMQIRLSQRPLIVAAELAPDVQPGSATPRASLGMREAAMVSLVSSLVAEHALDATAVSAPAVTAPETVDSPLCSPPSPESCSSHSSSLRSFNDAPSSLARPSHHTDSLLIPDSPPSHSRSQHTGPAYLRLPEPITTTIATGAVETNHLLLSGVDAEFVPERVFNHRRQQLHQASDGEDAMRDKSANTRGFLFGQRTRRSPSNVPPPLMLAGVERTPQVLNIEAGMLATPNTIPTVPLSAQSDAISFCTALSSLSTPTWPADTDVMTDAEEDAQSFSKELEEGENSEIAAPEPVEHPDDSTNDGNQSPVVPGPSKHRQASIMHIVMALEAGAASPAVSLSASGELQPSPQIPGISTRSNRADQKPQLRIVQEISPLSQKSVPVVVQARRARHPVYKFGALANDTFERGRHQDAYDLYSWALELLYPPQGTTAQEIVDRPDVRKQLARLGWQQDSMEVSERTSAATSFGLFSPAIPKPRSAGGVPSAPQSPIRESRSLHNASTGSLPLRRISEAWVEVDAADVIAEAQSPQQPQSAGRRVWNALSSRVGIKAASRPKSQPQPKQAHNSAVVINEPLPDNLAQTPSGKFEFSAEMLKQLKHRPVAVDSDSRADSDSDVDVGDSWTMAEGDEKAEVSALLYSNRSAAAYALGKYAAAASDAAKSVDLRGSWAKGHFRRGEALLALGRIRDAYVAYRQAATLDAHDMHIRVSCERARIMAQNDEMGLRVVQLLAGRDYALRPRGPLLHPIRTRIFEFAVAMQNYVYLIADADTRKCIVVDACWDVDGILAVVERENLLLAAAAVTHGHFDHIGGVPPPPFSSLHIRVSGVAELKRRMAHLPILVHPLDIPEVMAANPALKRQHFTPTPNGFNFKLGDRTDVQFLHTPGHTPGSQCLMVNGCRLFSGDTLFPGSCGRVDLKGGSLDDMVESLQTRLRSVPDSTIVYPGHEYGGEWTSIGREKKRGFLRHVGHGSAQEKWNLLDSKRQCCS